MKQHVTIKTPRQDFDLEATVIGNLAVHPSIMTLQGWSDSGIWTVTYLPTGHKIEDWRNEQIAIEAAHNLSPYFVALPNVGTREYEVVRTAIVPIIKAMTQWPGNIPLAKQVDDWA